MVDGSAKICTNNYDWGHDLLAINYIHCGDVHYVSIMQQPAEISTSRMQSYVCTCGCIFSTPHYLIRPHQSCDDCIKMGQVLYSFIEAFILPSFNSVSATISSLFSCEIDGFLKVDISSKRKYCFFWPGWGLGGWQGSAGILLALVWSLGTKKPLTC